jgi:hypothetical protein
MGISPVTNSVMDRTGVEPAAMRAALRSSLKVEIFLSSFGKKIARWRTRGDCRGRGVVEFPGRGGPARNSLTRPDGVREERPSF